MDLAPADLTRIRELYAQGYYRRAYDAADGGRPDPGVDGHAGAADRRAGWRSSSVRRSSAGNCTWLAFRSTPAYPEAIYYHARYRMERFGPLSTWEFMRKHPDWSDAPPELHADWLALSGFIAARLRDFDRAERWLNRAEAVAPAGRGRASSGRASTNWPTGSTTRWPPRGGRSNCSRGSAPACSRPRTSCSASAATARRSTS